MGLQYCNLEDIMSKIRFIVMAVLCLFVLAVGCSAYGVDFYGHIQGLEDGINYTAAKYDVLSDACGMYGKIDSETVLSSGVWAIKADGGEPEYLFVEGEKNGQITFWDTEEDKCNASFGGKSDKPLPGKWTFSGGAFTRITASSMKSDTIPTVCLTVDKSKVVVPLPDGDKYAYATPLKGEGNLLQESSLSYGFTAEQIVPASKAVSVTFPALSIRTGSFVYTEGYSNADEIGEFTFIVKTPGKAEYERYTVDTNTNGGELVINAPEAMKESEGYVVGFTYAPYSKTPNEIYTGNRDNAAFAYAHIGMKKGENRLETTESVYPAPVVYDGFGIIGGKADRTYEIARATISSDGKGLELGEWVEYSYSAGRERDLAGLYAIRETNNGQKTQYTFAYAYGDNAERQNVLDLNAAGTHLAVCTDLDEYDRAKFYTAMWSGDVCNSAALGIHTIFDHSQVVLTAYTAAKTAYDNADDDTREAAKAALDAEAAKLVTGINGIRYKYAFDSEGIIRTNEAVSFNFNFYCNNTTLETKTLTTKVVAYVADRSGNVKTYEVKHTQPYAKDFSYTANFADFLPEDGWLVAFDVYPNTDNTADNIVKTADGGFRYPLKLNSSSYVIKAPEELPKSDAKPEGLYFENGVIAGLDKSLAYEYAPFDINGIGAGDWTYVTGVSELETDARGLIAVKFSGDGYSHSGSAYTYVYIPGNSLTDIIHTTLLPNKNGTAEKDVIDVSNAGGFAATRGRVVFNEGRWTGIVLDNSLALNHGFNRFILGCASTPIAASWAEAIRDAADGAALALARENAAKVSADIYYSYAYKGDEIIPMSDFLSFTYNVAVRQGGFTVNGSTQSKFVFKVVDGDGNLVDRAVYKAVDYSKTGTKVIVTAEDFDDTTGYIVGIVIYPYVLTEGSYFEFKESANGDYNVYLSENCYKVDSIMPSEKPMLSAEVKNALITVTNYNEKVGYAYSDNGGESWVAFEGKSFNATRASREYVVKALANKDYLESPVSEAVTSPEVVVSGISLVLDGRIGVKVYMDIDKDSIKSMNLYTTKVNSDYFEYKDKLEYGEGYRVGANCSFDSGNDWLTPITLGENGLYYTVFSVPAKDVDNVTLEVDLGAFMKADGQRVSFGNFGGGLNIPYYIAKAKELAADGNDEFIKALGVIEALETYTAYADNYFGKGGLEEYSARAVIEAEEASHTGNIEGASFYGTSLLLKDTVTIRHYFEVEDAAAFLARYTANAPHGVKNGYVYYDIADIPAQDMGERQILTIKDSEGKAYEIAYSVANYVESATAESNSRLVSLMNAMYDYGKAAYSYENPKPLYVRYDSGISVEGANGGLHIYIPASKGYIDHTYVHTVSADKNSDVWRLSLVYACDDSLENPVAITTANAEWDMALMLSGRPDFIGGWAHGDEIMTDVKFILDGKETAPATLIDVTEFNKLEIVENSVGYDPGNTDTAVLKHHKEYTVNHAGIRLEQKVEWLGDYTVSHSYLAMMPPAKKYTDSYYTNITEPDVIDLSGGKQETVDGATSVTVYGEESGFYFTMTVNEYDTFIKPYMSIADNGGGAYNKMYFTFVKNGNVAKGDVWETFTHYRIEHK